MKKLSLLVLFLLGACHGSDYWRRDCLYNNWGEKRGHCQNFNVIKVDPDVKPPVSPEQKTEDAG